jgi:hypothetical protein
MHVARDPADAHVSGVTMIRREENRIGNLPMHFSEILLLVTRTRLPYGGVLVKKAGEHATRLHYMVFCSEEILSLPFREPVWCSATGRWTHSASRQALLE